MPCRKNPLISNPLPAVTFVKWPVPSFSNNIKVELCVVWKASRSPSLS